MLACTCLPWTCSHPNLHGEPPPYPAMTLLRETEGHRPSPNCLIPPHCWPVGLMNPHKGRKKRWTGKWASLGWSWWTHTVRKSYAIWHGLLSDVRHPPIPTYHPGNLLVDETVPQKGAFRVNNLLAARREVQSILKWGWPCSPSPSRSSKLQLLDDGVMRKKFVK